MRVFNYKIRCRTQDCHYYIDDSTIITEKLVIDVDPGYPDEFAVGNRNTIDIITDRLRQLLFNLHNQVGKYYIVDDPYLNNFQAFLRKVLSNFVGFPLSVAFDALSEVMGNAEAQYRRNKHMYRIQEFLTIYGRAIYRAIDNYNDEKNAIKTNVKTEQDEIYNTIIKKLRAKETDRDKTIRENRQRANKLKLQSDEHKAKEKPAYNAKTAENYVKVLAHAKDNPNIDIDPYK